jgi:hypothetical protein
MRRRPQLLHRPLERRQQRFPTRLQLRQQLLRIGNRLTLDVTHRLDHNRAKALSRLLGLVLKIRSL